MCEVMQQVTSILFLMTAIEVGGLKGRACWKLENHLHCVASPRDVSNYDENYRKCRLSVSMSLVLLLNLIHNVMLDILNYIMNT